jgi:hypothetical protein
MPKKQKSEPLTEVQRTALKAFADANGRHWKRHLSDAWMTGAYPGNADSGTLQQLRNTRGPSWLVWFNPSELEE